MTTRQKEHPLIHRSGFNFLKTLKKNNNRQWFNAHKTIYQQELDLVETFVEALLRELNQHDVIETPSARKSMHRIYRDIRFSNDKTPYKTNWSGNFKRATKYRRGGYYYHIEPGDKTYIAGGFWGPNAQDLKRIRDDIAFDATPLRKILKSRAFVTTFGTLQGEQLKTAPQGFDARHENIDLLRYKQFLLIRKFTDTEVLSNHFLKEANQAFKNMRPFFDYMSEVLVMDANGMEV